MRRLVVVSAILFAGCGSEQTGPGEQEHKAAPRVLTAAVVSQPVTVLASVALLGEANA